MNSNPKLIDEYFYKFFQCPHWLWYDLYADATAKKEFPPLLSLIYKGKVGQVSDILSKFKTFEEVSPDLMKDVEEGFLATLALMKEGKNIYRGALMDADWVGMPDFLEARPGKSKFGEFEYVVYDVQSSLELRDEQKFQLVFYSLILERIQGTRPKEAFVIDANGNTRSFLVDDFVEQFELTCQSIEKILAGDKPAPFLKSGCKKTPWYTLCLADAQGCNDVSLIHRLSQADQRRLYSIGVKTVEDLANMDVNVLESKLEDWPFDKVLRFSNQAKALANNEQIVLKKPDFPKVRHEVYFDVEGDPLSSIYYLLGIVVKDTEAVGIPPYRSFLAKSKEEEKKIWQDFLDFVAGLDDFVIYHFASYERQVFDYMVRQYGAPEQLVRKFNENTIDLYNKVVETVVLPLYFYTLKDVAKYLGFSWNDPHAGGAESVVWYNDWLKSHDEGIMERILKYNEDDVRATLMVKDWLSQQRPRPKREAKEELPTE